MGCWYIMTDYLYYEMCLSTNRMFVFVGWPWDVSDGFYIVGVGEATLLMGTDSFVGQVHCKVNTLSLIFNVKVLFTLSE